MVYLLAYLIPLSILQIFAYITRKRLTDRDYTDITVFACVPVVNIIGVVFMLGYLVNKLFDVLNKMMGSK